MYVYILAGQTGNNSFFSFFYLINKFQNDIFLYSVLILNERC